MALIAFIVPIGPMFAAQSSQELSRLGREAYRAGDWTTCGERYAEASRASEGDAVRDASYSAACCFARGGMADRAFAELERATAGGLRDLVLLESDTDLESLRGDPRWAEVRAKVGEAARAYRAGVNAELLDLHDQDQADRRGAIDWSKVSVRDAERRQRVLEIMSSDGSFVADDYYHAAMVFQHGGTPEEIQRAVEWATKAWQLDPENMDAAWLSAAAEDRYLMYQGKPQKYATQFKKVDGRWILWEVDPSISDEERAKRGCRTLAEAQARAEAMNRPR